MRPTSFTIAVLLALVSVVAAAVAVAGDRGGPDPSLGTMSNAGEPFDVRDASPESRRTLEVTGAVRSPRFVARRGPVAFYTAEHAGGSGCYLTGSADEAGPLFGSVFCLQAEPAAFPSQSNPVLDMSSFSYDTATGVSRLEALAGFAADGVAWVGIVDDTGTPHLARVVRNVYAATDAAGSSARAVVALDRGGREVYRMPLVGP